MITVKNVTKKYGKFKAVDNISFEINDGEIIGLLGPNGAGKSTTMNILTGFIEPTEGEVIINGYNISKKPKKAKKCIGYMPEGVPLYKDMTVKEFVTYMAELKGVKKDQIKESVDQAIQDTWLQNVRKVLIRNLSKGYKQRVSMAGALVGNPEIIILDEPTVGLDAVNRNYFYDALIESYSENPRTIIIATHLIEEVENLLEEVVIIKDGDVKITDSLEDIRKKAYYISGNQEKLNSIFELENQTPIKHFGDNYTYWYYGDLNQNIKDKMDELNISYENISLNDLFLSMNRKDVALYE